MPSSKPSANERLKELVQAKQLRQAREKADAIKEKERVQQHLQAVSKILNPILHSINNARTHKVASCLIMGMKYDGENPQPHNFFTALEDMCYEILVARADLQIQCQREFSTGYRCSAYDMKLHTFTLFGNKTPRLKVDDCMSEEAQIMLWVLCKSKYNLFSQVAETDGNVAMRFHGFRYNDVVGKDIDRAALIEQVLMQVLLGCCDHCHPNRLFNGIHECLRITENCARKLYTYYTLNTRRARTQPLPSGMEVSVAANCLLGVRNKMKVFLSHMYEKNRETSKPLNIIMNTFSSIQEYLAHTCAQTQ